MKTYEYLCQSVGEMEAIRAYLEKRGWSGGWPSATQLPVAHCLVFYTTIKHIGRISPTHLGDPMDGHYRITLHEIFAGKLERVEEITIVAKPYDIKSETDLKVTPKGVQVGAYVYPLTIIDLLAKAKEQVLGGAK